MKTPATIPFLQLDAGELHNELVAAGADFEFDFDDLPADDDDLDDLEEVEVELD